MHLVSTVRTAAVLYVFGVNFDEPTEGGTQDCVLNRIAVRYGMNRFLKEEMLTNNANLPALLRFLVVDIGVDINQRDAYDYRTLHFMVRNEWIEGIELLLQYGADPNTYNTFHQRPLDLIPFGKVDFQVAAKDLFARYDDAIVSWHVAPRPPPPPPLPPQCQYGPDVLLSMQCEPAPNPLIQGTGVSDGGYNSGQWSSGHWSESDV